MILNLIISINIVSLIFFISLSLKSKKIIEHFIHLILFVNEELSKSDDKINYKKVKEIIKAEADIMKESGYVHEK